MQKPKRLIDCSYRSITEIKLHLASHLQSRADKVGWKVITTGVRKLSSCIAALLLRFALPLISVVSYSAAGNLSRVPGHGPVPLAAQDGPSDAHGHSAPLTEPMRRLTRSPCNRGFTRPAGVFRESSRTAPNGPWRRAGGLL